MGFFELLTDMVTDYTLRTVAMGAAVLGIVSGALGAFAVLRKQSLLGDAVSHAALPGIALAFILTRSKTPIVLILGAAVAGWIGTLIVMSVVKSTRIKYDSALGMILSVFFGFGLVLLTFIQKFPDATQAGLDTFLFGQASALLQRDVVTMAILGAIALIAVTLFWKEFKILCFDPSFGGSQGSPIWLLDIILTTLLVIAIVIGLQTVGVVLMSAMVVAPASAARQWTDKLGWMIVLSALFGAIAGVAGAVISSTVPRLPTGPAIVLCISAIVAISLFLSPNRGLLFKWIREKIRSRTLRLQGILSDLYELTEQHQDREHAHSEAVLRTMTPSMADIHGSLRELSRQGLVSEIGSNEWVLTEKGYQEAKRNLSLRGAQ
jgi:manganese/zinc/iron transport system permease protein